MRLKKKLMERLEFIRFKRGGFKKIKKIGKWRGIAFSFVAFSLLLKDSRKFVIS